MNLVNGGHTHKYLTVSLIDDIRHACRAIYDRIAEIDYTNETLEEERAERKKKRNFSQDSQCLHRFRVRRNIYYVVLSKMPKIISRSMFLRKGLR